MLKQNLVKHAFHGEVETIGGTELTMSSHWVEGIEIVAFIVLIYVIFFRMNKHLFASSPKASENKSPSTGIVGGMVGVQYSKRGE